MKKILKQIGKFFGNEDFFSKKNLAAIIAVFAVGAIISYLIFGQAMVQKSTVDKVIKFVNENVNTGVTVTLQDYKLENGVIKYNFEMTSGGQSQSVILYSDLNASLLFTSAIPLAEEAKFDAPDSAVPTVELFVMSFCPYGVQAENSMTPVFDLLKEKANIELHFIVTEANEKITSLHGQLEVDENARQLCVNKEYGSEKLWQYLKKFNNNCTSDMKASKACSEKTMDALQIDSEKINECVKNDGNALLKAEAALSEQKGVQGSPTVIINGAIYEEERTSNALKEGICTGFKNVPSECAQELSDTQTAASGNC